MSITERVTEGGAGLPDCVSTVDTHQAAENTSPTSRQIRNSKSRLLRVVTPLVLAVGVLAIATACGGDGRGEQEETRTWTGILVDAESKCPTPEGCAAPFYLLNEDFSNGQIPMDGKVLDKKYDGFIVEIEGTRESDIAQITELTPINDFPSSPFLSEATPRRFLIEYRCDVSEDYDIAEFFRLDGEAYILGSRLTNTAGGPGNRPYPFVEFTYNGRTGEYLDSDVEPNDYNPCP